MNKMKRIFALLIMTAVVAVSNPAYVNDIYAVTTATDANTLSTWQRTALITPIAGNLYAAGYIDITWKAADELGTVSDYKVYINGSLAYTASPSTLKYEYYTTTVSAHRVYIVADFIDGSSATSSTFIFYVTKKGLAVNDSMGKRLDPLAMNMGWYYTWGQSPFSYTTYSYLEFVPMIWGNSNTSNIPNVAAKGYKYLLAYNEPDMTGDAGGSNMNVNVAINNWSKFLGYNYYLGSPAPAFCPAWGNGTWFRNFMNGIDQSTIDFIPLHCYYKTYGGKSAANAFLTQVVDATYEMYGKPIWITEFAPSGWGYSNTYGRKQCKEFLEEVIKGLNERSYVERYSWFSFDTKDETNGASALWTNSTGILTELGQVYVSNGNPEGYYNDGSSVAFDNSTIAVVYADAPNTSSNTDGNTNTTSTVSKPGRAVIKSVKSKSKKSAKIVIKKVAGAKGYQIKYSDSKKFCGYMTKIVTKRTVTIKKLDRKTKYYFKVRAYKKNGSKKLYGSWSKVKSVKVK